MGCDCGECTCCMDGTGTMSVVGTGATGNCMTLKPQEGLCSGFGGPNYINLLTTQGVSCGGDGNVAVCIDPATSNVAFTPSPTSACEWSANVTGAPDQCLPQCACDSQEQELGSAVGGQGTFTALMSDVQATVTNTSGCDWRVLEMYTPKCQYVQQNNVGASIGLEVIFSYEKSVNGGAFSPAGCPSRYFENYNNTGLGNTYNHTVSGSQQVECITLPPGGTYTSRWRSNASINALNNNWAIGGGASISLFASSCGA